MFDVKDTLMSQYANSPAIVGIIEGIADALDPEHTAEEFYSMLWRLSSATSWGLDIWGRIVGVNRNVQMSDPDAITFGFKTDPVSQNFTPFNVAPFSAGGAKFNTYRLPDNLYKELIIIKAASNILYATAPNINKYLQMIFTEKVYYYITGHMTAKYIFEFELTAVQRLIVYTLKLLPEPCGVLISYEEKPIAGVFGFDGTEYETFDHGVFIQ